VLTEDQRALGGQLELLDDLGLLVDRHAAVKAEEAIARPVQRRLDQVQE
jgi:hypothetical protein